MGRLRCLLGLGIALAAAGCQVKAPTSNAVQYPFYIRFPENEVATGVSVFRNAMARGGMVEVAGSAGHAEERWRRAPTSDWHDSAWRSRRRRSG